MMTANGRESLEKGSYDLVLMDVQMPEMDGLEATTALYEELRRILSFSSREKGAK
jgi:two-component system sensor histidine kinase/response regulator